MVIKVEYVCTGNNGRSPMAEAIAKADVLMRGLEDQFEISSSGSGLSVVTRKTGDDFKRQKLAIVKMGLDNGLYSGWSQGMAEEVQDQQLEAADFTLDFCFDYLIKAEAVFRDLTLSEVGLRADSVYHKPTEAKGEANIILPMTEGNAEQVHGIYLGSSVGFAEPPVVPISKYAGLEGEVTNPFCQLQPVYQQTRDDLMRIVPKTIDRALEDFEASFT